MTKTPENTVNKDKKNVCLIVLGPHRSGTSALTGVLSKLCADLPESLMAATEANPDGYFESQKVMEFNERLLTELGSRWDDIAPLNLGAMPEQVLDAYLDEAVDVLKEEFVNARIPLIKDPRICRFVGFWREACERFGYAPVFIHTHRNPLETAQSLERRDGIPIEVGLLIWQRHVIEAEAATRGATRVFTNYQDLLNDWRKQISKIEETIGFSFHRNTPVVRQEVDKFLQVGLRHQTRDRSDVYRSSEVADVVRDTFRILENFSEPDDYDRLDHLRNKFDGAVDQVGTFMQALRKTRQKLGAQRKAQEQAMVEINNEKAVITAELDHLRKETDEKGTTYSRRVAELEQDVAKSNHEKSQLAEAIEMLRESERDRITQLEGELRQRSLEAEQWFTDNKRLEDEKKELEVKNSRLEVKMKELEAKNSKLEAEMGALEAKNSKLEAEMVKLKAKKAELEAEKVGGEKLKENLQTDLRERDNSILVLQGNIQRRFDEIARVSSILLETEKHLQDERSRNGEKLADLQKKFEAARSDALKEHERVTALLSSTSWKLTGPLRRLVLLFRQ